MGTIRNSDCDMSGLSCENQNVELLNINRQEMATGGEKGLRHLVFGNAKAGQFSTYIAARLLSSSDLALLKIAPVRKSQVVTRVYNLSSIFNEGYYI